MIKIGKLAPGLFVLGLLFALNTWANTTVQSTVDRNEMSVGDTFTLTVTVNSSESVDIQDPRIPEIEGFELVNTWQSTAVSQKLVQGKNGMEFQTQRRKEFSFLLSPRNEGNLSVSSFEVVVSGKVYRTQPVLVKVLPKGQSGLAQNNPRQQPRNPMPNTGPFGSFDAMDDAEEEIFNQLLQQRQRLLQNMGMPDEVARGRGGSSGMANPAYRSLPTNPDEAFFIQVEVDKTEVYEGEQVNVNWYIYTRGLMETLDRLKFPSLKGFWKEIVEEVPSIQFTEEVVNGLPYKKALLASHALFPIKAGTATIDEYKIKSRVRVPTDGMGGFFGRAYEFTKSSKPVEIKVKALPVADRPKDFTGAVGQFDVTAVMEQTSLPVNQPVSLRVRFEGAGNAKLIDLPAIQWPDGIEVYDTKSDSKFFKNGRSFKEFEVLLIPRQEGALTIPALSFSGFDPREQKYYTKQTNPIQVTVVANPNAPVGSSQRMADGKAPAAPVVAKGQVLPDVVTSWDSVSNADLIKGHPAVWIGIYLAMALAFIAKSKKEFGWGRRRKSLKDLVAKRYKKVETQIRKGNFRGVGAEMTNTYYFVLGEISGTGGATLEISKLLEMIPPSLRQEHGEAVLASFANFETLTFAPEEMLGSLKTPERMQEEYKKAQKIISALIS